MKDLTKKWFFLADYDLKSAEAMLKSKRYLYVAFMCQQAIEKLLKGLLYEKTENPPPYTHRLMVLAEEIGFTFSEEQKELLNKLTRYYINARYPEIKQNLAKNLNKTKPTHLLLKTKELFQWLKKESGILKKF